MDCFKNTHYLIILTIFFTFFLLFLETNPSELTTSLTTNLGIADNINEELVTATSEIIDEIDINEEQKLQLSVADSFLSWELAEAYLNNYAKAARFSLRRKRVTTNNDGEITRRTFECTHSGKPVSNQVIDLSQQRNRNSRKIACP